jgi:hypothetical protein
MNDPSHPDLRQDETVRANYPGEEAREKHLSGEPTSSRQLPTKTAVRTRGGVTGHNVRYGPRIWPSRRNYRFHSHRNLFWSIYLTGRGRWKSSVAQALRLHERHLVRVSC